LPDLPYAEEHECKGNGRQKCWEGVGYAEEARITYEG